MLKATYSGQDHSVDVVAVYGRGGLLTFLLDLYYSDQDRMMCQMDIGKAILYLDSAKLLVSKLTDLGEDRLRLSR